MNISITTTAKSDEEAKALCLPSKFRSRIEANMAKLALINRDESGARWWQSTRKSVPN